MDLRGFLNYPENGIVGSICVQSYDEDADCMHTLYEKIASEGDMYDGVIAESIADELGSEMLDWDVIYAYAEMHNGRARLVIEI